MTGIVDNLIDDSSIVNRIDHLMLLEAPMTVATRADAATFARDGFTFRPLAVPSRGSRELAVWTLEAAPGAHGAPHTLDREEIFVVESGRIAATVDGEAVALGAGDALVVPAGALFELRAEEPARLTVCTSAGVQARLASGGAAFPPPWAL